MRQKVRAAKGRFATRPYSLAENTEKKQKKEKNASRRVAPHRSRSLSQPHRHHIRPRPVPTLTYHSHFCISYGPGFPPCHPILKYYRASCPPVSVRSLNLPPTQKKKKKRSSGSYRPQDGAPQCCRIQELQFAPPFGRVLRSNARSEASPFAFSHFEAPVKSSWTLGAYVSFNRWNMR